ncbi:hypothetical protein SARC_09970 [Sphaeroforma arctica JP610]|uniref:Hormone-sensitive lipase n=1 Tax=Sphaeroforma arctica JP610 TaxID=667725 RepID=A0A0L0FLC2_9EUKA|nr:hypothetical protein SARC_09970 [Sphaeroforma arctica JP610]KNC77567.1 hypothetical protein SARC_09970 [Sphaeroforma arctica JP610]|eukprot:XP_014151469.1 hypothetical protein SARC_09970 [Sphaeroforma arctica JP610]
MDSWEEIETRAQASLAYVQVALRKATDKNTVDAKNLKELEIILEKRVLPRMISISKFMHEYDLDASTPGNGYRSLVAVTLKYIRKVQKVMDYVVTSRMALKIHPTRILPVINRLLTCQGEILDMAIECHTHSGPDKRLILSDFEGDLLVRFRNMDKKPFYGSMNAVQFDGALRAIFEFMLRFTASYSANRGVFNRDVPLLTGLTTMMSVPLFAADSERRAAQCVYQFESHNTSFLQSFWNMTESFLTNGAVNVAAPYVGESRRLLLSCREFTLKYSKPAIKKNSPLESTNVKSGDHPILEYVPDSVEVAGDDDANMEVINIPVPANRSVPLRIIRSTPSHNKFATKFRNKLKSKVGKVPVIWSKGMRPPTECEEVETLAGTLNEEPGVKSILFHIHGGGFVAQTSRSHQVYLKRWAKELNIMIISIDYSLAPQNPFPSALDECFYAYSWIISHAEKMGYSAGQICLSGDSAGGNLVVALGLKIVKEGLPAPFAIQANYPALCVRMYPSPARLLSASDILLPLGILEDCLDAYTPGGGVGSGVGRVVVDTVDPLLSPWHADDELLSKLPPIYIVSGNYDPLLDDAVDFARKLRNAGGEVKMTIVDKAAHGFLQFVDIGGSHSKEAQTKVLEDLKEMFSRCSDAQSRGLHPKVSQREYELGWVDKELP